MRKRENRNPITLILVIAAVSALVLCLVMLFTWRQTLSEKNRLEEENARLQTELQAEEETASITETPDASVTEPEEDKTSPAADGAFDYLAIGNSVTENPPYGGIWWGDWGMAASSEEKDYVHLVKAGIEEEYPVCNLEVFNFRVWEQPFYDREDHLELLDGYLSEQTDLVTVQLGENITNMGELDEDRRRIVLTEDYGNLISYIRERAQTARIILLGSVFEEDFRDGVIEEVCADLGATFLSLKEIQKEEYRVGNAPVNGVDGETHEITDPLVALHPNDRAMEYIADRILEALGLSKEVEPAALEELLPETEAEEDADVTASLQGMTLEEKVYQMMILTPEQLTGVGQVTASGNATREALTAYPVGGLIYFEQNLESPEQTKKMLADLQEIAREVEDVPLFTCVDEEGGKVTRIGKNTAFSAPQFPNLNTVTEKEEAKRIGSEIGAYLKELGFNLDFAPVADVWTNPENTVVKERSFGMDPFQVTELCSAYSEGLHENGILSTWKHYPGHGGTAGDTHEGLAVLDKTWEDMREAELIPFSRAGEMGADLVMSCHISLPQVLGNDEPGTFSRELITEKLRNELGYSGLIVTDALNMGAVTQRYSSADAGRLAVAAGNDLILMPEDFKVAAGAIIQAVQEGSISEEQIDASVERILKAKKRI